ncbi:MAG: hypothetical protein ACLS4Z_02560 [Christensenellaceae bacterium]
MLFNRRNGSRCRGDRVFVAINLRNPWKKQQRKIVVGQQKRRIDSSVIVMIAVFGVYDGWESIERQFNGMGSANSERFYGFNDSLSIVLTIVAFWGFSAQRFLWE